MKYILSISLFFTLLFVRAQSNIVFTNATAEQYVLGQYNPSNILSGELINPNEFAARINAEINPDSLKSYIIKLASFSNRNTGSDTSSNTVGIGAARRWVYNKFLEFENANPRLKPSYLQFDQLICNVKQHRNIMAVVPGADTSNKSIVIVEGHIDSRCDDVCDSLCIAEGVEDNASGTALVMELARVMSKYQLQRTIVFAVVIGEEQGLFGAEALSKYCTTNKINVRAVFNNDVIGGIICGKTASAPGCPGENEIDSTNVRLFSAGAFNSKSKSLARFTKLQYEEDLRPIVSVPMDVNIMTFEDRTGRGGDHIPFREAGFAAIRLSSANEHGDASNGSSYTDRQHTSDDVLGVDTDNDMKIDSFFVDFNYLGRNAVINGTAAAAAANGLSIPSIQLTQLEEGVEVSITTDEPGIAYKIGIRVLSNDFDTLYTTTNLKDTIPNFIGDFINVTAASVDVNGIESLFSDERRTRVTTGIIEGNAPKEVVLLANKPNPFDESTTIMFETANKWQGKKATITITDVSGKIIATHYKMVEPGLNEVLYVHGFRVVGTYFYSITIDDVKLGTKAMVFAN